MGDRDTYEKDNTTADPWALKLYLAVVVFLVGALTVYQSTTGTDAPFTVGVVVAVVSAGYIVRQLRAAT